MFNFPSISSHKAVWCNVVSMPPDGFRATVIDLLAPAPPLLVHEGLVGEELFALTAWFLREQRHSPAAKGKLAWKLDIDFAPPVIPDMHASVGPADPNPKRIGGIPTSLPATVTSLRIRPEETFSSMAIEDVRFELRLTDETGSPTSLAMIVAPNSSNLTTRMGTVTVAPGTAVAGPVEISDNNQQVLNSGQPLVGLDVDLALMGTGRVLVWFSVAGRAPQAGQKAICPVEASGLLSIGST